MLDKLKKFFIGLILAALALSSCTRAVPSENSSLDKASSKEKKSWFGASIFKPKTTPTPPGDYVMTIDVDGETIEAARTRSYTMHIPAAYTGENPVALFIAISENGMSGKKFNKEAELQKYTDSGGNILVFPDAYGEKLEWNNGIIPGSGANDVLFLQTLITRLQEVHNINPKQIYLIGFGQGGILAYQVASATANEVAAVGVVGASVGFRAEKGGEVNMIQPAIAPVSVIMIHGMRDDVIPFALPKDAKKNSAGYQTFDQSEGYWVTTLGCEGSPKVRITRNEHIIRHTWEGCNGGSSLVSISINTGKHVWFQSATAKESKKPSISATDAIFSFLMSNPKP